MRVGILQYDVAHDVNQNFKHLEVFLQQRECDVVVLPELSMCGYLFHNRKQLLASAEPVPSGRSTQAMLALFRL